MNPSRPLYVIICAHHTHQNGIVTYLMGLLVQCFQLIAYVSAGSPDACRSQARKESDRETRGAGCALSKQTAAACYSPLCYVENQT